MTDRKTMDGAHVTEYADGWSPRGTRRRQVRPAEGAPFAELREKCCSGCGYHLCACAMWSHEEPANPGARGVACPGAIVFDDGFWASRPDLLDYKRLPREDPDACNPEAWGVGDVLVVLRDEPLSAVLAAGDEVKFAGFGRGNVNIRCIDEGIPWYVPRGDVRRIRKAGA